MNPNLPTGPTIIVDDLPPRGWLDTETPKFPTDCNRLDFYSRWLADYLASHKVLPHQRQAEYLEGLHISWIEQLMNFEGQSLGGEVAVCMGTIELIEASHAHGETWQEFRTRQHLAWRHGDEHHEFDFENEYCCHECTWIQIGAEWREKMAIDDLANFPDIPYRYYLAQEVRHQLTCNPIGVVRDFLSYFDFDLNQS